MIIINTVFNMRCKTPKLIYVKDYKTFIKVPCNSPTCYACSCNKRAEWVLRSQVEYSKHIKNGGSAYFCTFTYNDDHLYAPHLPPQTRKLKLDTASLKAGEFKDIDFNYYDEYSDLDFFPSGEYPDYGDFLLNPDHASELCNNLQNNYRMMYYPEEFKLFKKYSQMASRYYNKEDYQLACYYKELAYKKRPPLVRMYIVGEYGDLTNRPHLHSLFFFKNFVTQEDLIKLLSTVWQYGNIDVGYSVETAAINYVAKHQVKDCCGNEFQQKVSPIFSRVSKYDGGLGYDLRFDPVIKYKYDHPETEEQAISIIQGSKEFYFSFPRYVRKFLHPDKLTYDEIQDVVNVTNDAYYKMVTETAITAGIPFDINTEKRVFEYNKEQDEIQRKIYKENKLTNKKLHYHG